MRIVQFTHNSFFLKKNVKLGRIVEHWLLNKLGMKSTPRFFDLIREAEIAG